MMIRCELFEVVILIGVNYYRIYLWNKLRVFQVATLCPEKIDFISRFWFSQENKKNQLFVVPTKEVSNPYF